MDRLLDYPLLTLGGLMLLLWLSHTAGRVVRTRFAANQAGDQADSQTGLEAVIFALLGLLLAFTFAAAAARFEARGATMVEEANAIGTAWLRIDLLAEDLQPGVRADFRRYVALRKGAHTGAVTEAAFLARMQEANALQRRIWSVAVAAGAAPDARGGIDEGLLPALNDMIDITTTRAMQTRMHTPAPVLLALLLLALLCTFVVGFGRGAARQLDRLRLGSYCLVVGLTLYLCLDLEFPRRGLIRLDRFEADLVALSGV